MNIVLSVVFTVPDHSLTGMKEASRLRRGDITNVYRESQAPNPPAPTRNTIFIRIRNVPDTKIFRRIKYRLIGKVTYVEIIDEGNEPAYTVAHTDRMREWSFQFDQLTPQQRTAIRDDRQIIMQWGNARPMIRKKVIISRLDSLQDNLSTEVQEVDFD